MRTPSFNPKPAMSRCLLEKDTSQLFPIEAEQTTLFGGPANLLTYLTKDLPKDAWYLRVGGVKQMQSARFIPMNE